MTKAKTKAVARKTEVEGTAEEKQVVTIQVNVDEMTIGDLELLEKWAVNSKKEGVLIGEEISVREVIAFLDRIIVGGVRQYKVTELGSIMEAVTKQIKSISNPVSASGN